MEVEGVGVSMWVDIFIPNLSKPPSQPDYGYMCFFLFFLFFFICGVLYQCGALPICEGSRIFYRLGGIHNLTLLGLF